MGLEISLVLTDNKEIQELNREYRNMDKATDVLSFPLLDLDPYDRDAWLSDLQANVTPENGEAVLGVIVISMELRLMCIRDRLMNELQEKILLKCRLPRG